MKVVLTYEDYAALPNDGKRYEILDGELSVTAAPGRTHQHVILRLAAALDAHVTAHDHGEIYIAPFDVILAETTVVSQTSSSSLAIGWRSSRSGVRMERPRS